MITNKKRILSAIARLNNAESYLLYLMNERKGYNKKATKFDVESALFEIRNARTFLKNLNDVEIIIKNLEMK